MTCKAQKLFKRAGALLLILTLLLGMACVHAEEAGEDEEGPEPELDEYEEYEEFTPDDDEESGDGRQ